MKPAHLFVEALRQGISPAEAILSLPTYEPLYIHRLPVEVYRSALKGWRFFPVSSSKHPTVTHTNLFQAATNNLQQLQRWGCDRPNWAVATGPDSVFVLEVDGSEGLDSLLNMCGDDWRWLDTLRSIAGEKRCIFFAYPEGRRQISRGLQLKGLRIIGEGDWVLIPPCRDSYGVQHAYMNPGAEIAAAPAYLLERAFGPANKVDPLQPFPPCSPVLAMWSGSVLAEATHDQI
jgi:hypothetical protein